MNTSDRLRYLESLRECVAIAIRNGYTPEQVATDIRVLSTPPPEGLQDNLQIEVLTPRRDVARMA